MRLKHVLLGNIKGVFYCFMWKRVEFLGIGFRGKNFVGKCKLKWEGSFLDPKLLHCIMILLLKFQC